MDDKITLTITRRKFTEILIGLVAVFFASGAIATILKYLWPESASKGASVEVMIANVDEVPTGSVKKFMFNIDDGVASNEYARDPDAEQGSGEEYVVLQRHRADNLGNVGVHAKRGSVVKSRFGAAGS